MLDYLAMTGKKTGDRAKSLADQASPGLALPWIRHYSRQTCNCLERTNFLSNSFVENNVNVYCSKMGMGPLIRGNADTS